MLSGVKKTRSKCTMKGLERINNVSRLRRADSRASKPHSASTASVADIYGWLDYYSDPNEELAETGLVKANPDGSWTSIMHSETTCTGMGIADGVAYLQIAETYWGYVRSASNLTIDVESGQVLSETPVDVEENLDGYYYGAAYDMENMCAYAYVAIGETPCLVKVDLATGDRTTIAEVEDIQQQVTFNSKSGLIVAVNYENELIGVNPATGTETLITTISEEYASDYIGGLCYSASDDAYYWNSNGDEFSYLVKVTESGSVEKVCDVDLIGEYTALCCTDSRKPDPEAPGKAVVKEVSFEGAATTGSVIWTLPTETAGRTTLSGDVHYAATLDGADFKSGQAAAGSDLEIEYAALADGNHTFGLTLSVDGKEGAHVKVTRYIGNDTPKAPAKVTLTDAEVSWDAVTEGVNSGYLDLSRMTYAVTLNGVEIAKDISATSCPTGLTADTPLDCYTAEVIAECSGKSSSAASSNYITFGETLPLPLSMTPTEQESHLFSVIDVNEDNSTWTYDSENNAFMYGYNSDNDANDWLFLPPVKVTDVSRMLYYTQQYKAESSNYVETFEVKIGKEASPEAMTVKLADIATSEKKYQTLEKYFTLEEAGIYYIGIHATSKADSYNMYIKDFQLCLSNITPQGPRGVSEIVATAAPLGALKATVAMKFPTEAIDGTAFPANAVVTAIVTGTVGNASVKGAPGSVQSVEIATVQGMNKLSIQAECDGNFGNVVSTEVYTGLDAPGAPTNVAWECSEDNYSATITWEPPTEGVHGGYVAPTGITYYLCTPGEFGWELGDAIGTDVFEYEASVVPRSPLATVQIGILAVNNEGQGHYISAARPVLGLPYDTPATETFPDAKLTYSPVSIGGTLSDGTQTGIGDPATIIGEEYGYPGNSNALMCIDAAESTGIVHLPKFSTKDLDAVALELTVYMTPGIRVYAEGYGVEEQLIDDLSRINATGYHTVRINLPEELQNKTWVSLAVVKDFSAASPYLIIPKYTVRNILSHDLKAELIGTKSGEIGATLTFEATVSNEGIEGSEFKSGTFTVKKGDEVLATKTVSDQAKNLAPAESEKLSYSVEADANYVGDLTVTFAIDDADENLANNTSSINVKVKKGDAVAITDLKAGIDGNQVNLTWTAPVGRLGAESFEEETPFVLSPEKIGAFKNIDKDGSEVYTWNASSPVWNGAEKPGAFSVMDSSQLDGIFGKEDSFPAADGNQFIIAFCPAPPLQGGAAPAADDWLISPALGEGSEFSFSLKCLTDYYGNETIEILTATDDSDTDNFTILATIDTDNTSWEEYSYKLPAGARHFAIHYASTDIFGIMIDAINYVPAEAIVEIGCYEIYRQTDDGDFVKIADVKNTAYSDTEAELGRELRYYVIPVLANGTNGEKSNIAEAKKSGISDLISTRRIYAAEGEIVVRGFEGKHVTVVNLCGAVVANGTATEINRISVAPGVYVVKADNKIAKVFVK